MQPTQEVHQAALAALREAGYADARDTLATLSNEARTMYELFLAGTALGVPTPAPLADVFVQNLHDLLAAQRQADHAAKSSDNPDALFDALEAAGRVERTAGAALPGLLARLAAAEAHRATLQGALESSADTNRVLAERLKKAAKVLEGYEKWEASVLEEDAAWANRAGQPWGTQELYDEWMELQAKRNAVLRPMVKGGQQDA